MITRLDDGWQVREAQGESWRWFVSANPPVALNSATTAAEIAQTTRGWFEARVPGSITADLERAGLLDSPYRDRQSRAAEWVADRAWVYRRRLDLDEALEDQHLHLEFDGVDPEAHVYLDGEPIGHLVGMQRRHRIPVPAALATPGPHWLSVAVLPALRLQPQIGRTDAVTALAPRVTEGWDFCPRLLHQGIWREVRLTRGRLLLHDVTVRTTYDPDAAAGLLVVEADIQGAGADLTVSVGEHAISARPDETGKVHVELTVPEPEPWYPNGHGPQHLHDVTITARNASDEQTAQRRVGFRHVVWVRNPGSPIDSLPYTPIVNGRSVQCKGWNWTPQSARFGEIDPVAQRHALRLAAAGGATLLRVNGVGFVESEEFFDDCDELGLMVWQEFTQTSSGINSTPQQSPEFVRHCREEARALVPLITHHPSLVIWCGGNELLGEGRRPLADGDNAAVDALRAVVDELDPDRYWLPTSPSGPVFDNDLDMVRQVPELLHDVHGPWHHQGLEGQHELYDLGSSLAHTEFGVEGMTHMSTLEALISEEKRWPADRTNFTYRHLGEWWVDTQTLIDSFGPGLTTLSVQQQASQFLQAEGLGYAVDANMRRMPRMSMVLPWQLNETFPNAACTSVLDHWGRAKPAFHSVAAAYRTRRVSLSTERSAWGGHDEARVTAWLTSERPVGPGQLIVHARGLDGTVLAEISQRVPAWHHSAPVADLSFPLTDVPGTGSRTLFVWEALWLDGHGHVIDRFLMPATAAEDYAELPELSGVQLECVQDEYRLAIRHVGGPAAVGLRIIDDGPLDAVARPVYVQSHQVLFPGESMEVRLHGGDAVDPASWPFLIDAWGAASLHTGTKNRCATGDETSG